MNTTGKDAVILPGDDPFLWDEPIGGYEDEQDGSTPSDAPVAAAAGVAASAVAVPSPGPSDLHRDMAMLDEGLMKNEQFAARHPDLDTAALVGLLSDPEHSRLMEVARLQLQDSGELHRLRSVAVEKELHEANMAIIRNPDTSDNNRIKAIAEERKAGGIDKPPGKDEKAGVVPVKITINIGQSAGTGPVVINGMGRRLKPGQTIQDGRVIESDGTPAPDDFSDLEDAQ